MYILFNSFEIYQFFFCINSDVSKGFLKQLYPIIIYIDCFALTEYHKCFAEQSAEKKMKRYIAATLPIIEYIDKLYLSRNITLDW